MKWIIYKHTNKINGKAYIGQTCKKPEYRFNHGKGYLGADTHFARALKKYDFDNDFSHEYLETDIPTKEKANEREIYWIKYYDTYYNGYNETFGGDNHDHEGKEIYQLNPKTLEIISSYKSISDAARINKYNEGNIGRCCRKETIKAYGYYWCYKQDYLTFEPKEFVGHYVPIFMLDKQDYQILKEFKSIKDAAKQMKVSGSSIMAVCQRRNTYCKGYCWCYKKDYFKNWKPKERLQGEHGHRKVVCYETKRQFKSISAAARYLNTSPGNVLEVIKHPQKTVKGYHFCYLEEFHDNYVPPKQVENKRKIYCFELNKTYPSISECSKILHISSSQISSVCSGKEKTAGNMHFCYFDEKDTFIQQEGKRKKILCIETGKVYNSHLEAKNDTKARHIIECCKGTANSSNGLHFCYLKDKDKFIIKKDKSKKGVMCVETKEVFNKMKDAAIKYKINPSCLSACAKGFQKTAGGYHWKYVEDNN